MKDFFDSSCRYEVLRRAKASLRKASEVAAWDTETPYMQTNTQKNMSNLANLRFQHKIIEKKSYFTFLKRRVICHFVFPDIEHGSEINTWH